MLLLRRARDATRRTLTPSMAVALVALVVATTSTAYAAITVTGANVKNSSLTGKDVKDGSLGSADVKNGALRAKDFRRGELPAGATGATGPAGAKGDKGATGEQGSPGTNGADGTARAYAWVDGTSFQAPYTRNFTGVTRPQPGTYCLTPAAGIDPRAVPAAVSVDFGLTAAPDPSVRTRGSGGGCPAGRFEVRTFDGTTAANTVSFTIVVP